MLPPGTLKLRAMTNATKQGLVVAQAWQEPNPGLVVGIFLQQLEFTNCTCCPAKHLAFLID